MDIKVMKCADITTWNVNFLLIIVIKWYYAKKKLAYKILTFVWLYFNQKSVTSFIRNAEKI